MCENYSKVKIEFIKNVNAILNDIENIDNVEIKNREIEIDKDKIKIVNDKFKLNVGINTGFKCDIECKGQDYGFIIAISSILMMLVNYFDYVMQNEIKKRGGINEV